LRLASHIHAAAQSHHPRQRLCAGRRWLRDRLRFRL
jgi:hypothetical protein